MDRRKLVVALVGAVGLSLAMTPAEALTSAVVSAPHPAGRLVVHPCAPVGGGLAIALRAAAAVLVTRARVAHHDLLRLRAAAATVDATAVDTATAGTAVAVGDGPWVADEVDVTAVNTGTAGTAVTAVAVASTRRARVVDVTAVNTGILGTAVAVATPPPAPPPVHATRTTTSNVTAVNTGILGTAVAVGDGNGDVTAVNTGILGRAVAVGGGGNVGFPLVL